jgi:N-acetylmuramoyl-L-alanine amidase
MNGKICAEDVRSVSGYPRGVSARIFAAIFLNRRFAHVSPFFRASALAAVCSIFLPAYIFASVPFEDSRAGIVTTPSGTSADTSGAERRQAASSQFSRAEDQRQALNNKPAEKRTLNDYKQVVNSYRRVYLITPHAAEVPDALVAVAELYTEMGDRFGRTYYQSAVDNYQFLIREYPQSHYCPEAYLRSAQLQKDRLGDTAGAIKTYDIFLRKFPHSKQRREAQEARAELALLENSPTADSGKAALSKSPGLEAEGAGRTVSRATPADSPAEGTTGSVADNPAPANPAGRPLRVEKISAKGAPDAARVTIDLEGSVQYASGRVRNPDRIYFDLRGAQLAPQLLRAKIQSNSAMISAIRVAQNPFGVVRVVLEVSGVKDYTASLVGNPSRLVIDLYADARAVQLAQTNNAPAAPSVATPAAPSAAGGKPAEPTETGGEAKAIPEPKRTLGSAKGGRKPDLVQPASTPQPTHDGQSTLTRALGLKIGRIVIDAGHGGHDTGTIGPTGLMEKDLCLDVALRLGKIIQQRLPGADVTFTRSDDTFIPLEERTRIANEAKADMFVSIHANSSQDAGARGIETYYLNLKGSPEAMEVAARENASSSQGIHELEDLVKQIARTEKIDESREFAEDVQDSLSKRIQKTAHTVKNRGVRKAPFVVLIGADMPSILTEISFLSNPADEKLLKQPEHRQRVAEGIFQGIAGYLQSLNSMNVNETGTLVPRRTTTSAASAVDAPRSRN